MRFILSLLYFLPLLLQAQLYPIKVNRQWGLMDKAGSIIMTPRYDGIGSYNNFKLARFKDKGKVGLLDSLGQIVLNARFKSIEIINEEIFILTENGERHLQNRKGKVLLKGDFTEVKLYQSQYISYRKQGLKGLIDRKGKTIIPAKYEDITLTDNKYFLISKEGLNGVYSLKGKEIIPCRYKSIRLKTQGKKDFYFVKEKYKWGAFNEKGWQVIPMEYRHFQTMGEGFFKLIRNIQNTDLYSIKHQRIINKDIFGNYQIFSNNLVIVIKNFRSGLMDMKGALLLEPKYQSILEFTERRYRAKQNELWGIVEQGDKTVTPFKYESISTLNGNNCTTFLEGRYGILNIDGKEIIRPEYSKIELQGAKARAFKGNKLERLDFDESGALASSDKVGKYAQLRIRKRGEELIRRPFRRSGNSNFVVGDFEWVFDAEKQKWGLRRNEDGKMQIKPTFDRIDINRRHDFTVAIIEKDNIYRFERTTYRFREAFGIVNHEVGRLTTPVRLLDLKEHDFVNNPVARFLTDTGRFGLIKKNGKIIQTGYAFIGDFVDGKARMSKKGRMSGSMKKTQEGILNLNDFLKSIRVPKTMIDFTKYDESFRTKAMLICDKCEWGFVDTLGQEKIATDYLYANRFVNDVAIVKAKNNKWGLLDTLGQEKIECNYDGLDFLAGSDKKAVRVAQRASKYGLIDETGHLILESIYDKIGLVQEGMIPVKRGGYWGFANLNGREIIPCRFRKVKAFSNGLAAVQEGYRWGFVNRSGNMQIEATFSDVGAFSDGLAPVKTAQGYGYIDEKGAMAIEPQFARAMPFKEGIAKVKSNGRIGLIDKTGDYILVPKYQDISDFNEYGVARVQIRSDRRKFALIDKAGGRIGSKSFRNMGGFKDGLAAVQSKNGYGFINPKGELVIEDIYDKISDFNEGRAWVQVKSSCGYIDINGKVIVPLEYGKCTDFKDGVAVIFDKKRRGGFLGKDGRFILQPTIKKLARYSEGIGLVKQSDGHYFVTRKGTPLEGRYEKASAFNEGIARVRLRGKWGLINQQNIAIIPPKYDKIEAFQNGFAIVRSSQQFGLCDIEGKLIAQADYEYIEYAGDGLYRIEQGGKVGYFSQSGKWIWALKE